MLSITKIRGPLIMAIFPLQKYDLHIKSADDSVETPMERIKKLFVSTEYEPMSKELRTLKSLTITAAVVGMIAGGIIRTQGVVQKFIDNNQATRFYSHYDAQREAQTSFTIHFMKGGFKFGWRTALFTGIFGFIQLLLTTYYGEPSVLHYIAGGGIAGLLFKMSLGIRGSFAGLIVGSVLGGIGGSISLLFLRMTGHTLEDLYNFQQEWGDWQNAKYKEAMTKNLSEELQTSRLLYEENKIMQLSSEEKLSEKENEKARN